MLAHHLFGKKVWAKKYTGYSTREISQIEPGEPFFILERFKGHRHTSFSEIDLKILTLNGVIGWIISAEANFVFYK